MWRSTLTTLCQSVGKEKKYYERFNPSTSNDLFKCNNNEHCIHTMRTKAIRFNGAAVICCMEFRKCTWTYFVLMKRTKRLWILSFTFIHWIYRFFSLHRHSSTHSLLFPIRVAWFSYNWFHLFCKVQFSKRKESSDDIKSSIIKYDYDCINMFPF